MDDKPIIRHCRNCKYFDHYTFTDGGVCKVKYQYALAEVQRIKAIFCKYYKVKEEAE